jgi:hypothetical protein
MKQAESIKEIKNVQHLPLDSFLIYKAQIYLSLHLTLNNNKIHLNYT